MSREGPPRSERFETLQTCMTSSAERACKINRRVLPLEPAKEIFVILDAQLRVQAALEQNLNAVGGHGLVDLRGQLLLAQCITARLAGSAIEGAAKSAVDVADVRVVDVALDDVRHPPPGMQLVACISAASPRSASEALAARFRASLTASRRPSAALLRRRSIVSERCVAIMFEIRIRNKNLEIRNKSQMGKASGGKFSFF